jgi:NAD(P)-dependent dehydrogenase (short-subunit alcohol dehydrogenase family)
MKRNSKRIVLITGGGRGIGAACAKAFADGGLGVVIASRTKSELDKVAGAIAERHGTGSVLALVGDVSREAFVKRLFAAAHRKFGSVDILVNNAATLEVSDVRKTSAKTWDEILGVNLKGPFLLSRELFRRKKARTRRSVIVNINSLSGVMNTTKFPGLSAYVASKSGLTGLTEALAVEGRPLGIDVFGIAPGAVSTSLLKKAAPRLKAGATPEDIAGVVFSLATSGPTAFLSGATLPMDTNL